MQSKGLHGSKMLDQIWNTPLQNLLWGQPEETPIEQQHNNALWINAVKKSSDTIMSYDKLFKCLKVNL